MTMVKAMNPDAIEEYKDAICELIAMILRETRDPEISEVDVDVLESVFSEAPDREIFIDELLEFISNASGESFLLAKRGGKQHVKVLDKIALYLMLYKLNYNMAVPGLLHWSDFERLVEYALGENGFVTKRNFRFEDMKGQRHEIDVIAAEKHAAGHLVLAIDAKHWNYRSGGSAARMLEAGDKQFKRVLALGDSPGVLGDLFSEWGLDWTDCSCLPMVVTLLAPPVQDFYIPVVSILSFNNFILNYAENAGMYKKKVVEGIQRTGKTQAPVTRKTSRQEPK